MEEKENLILEFMKEENYVPMKAQEIAYMLSVPKEEYENFIMVLNKLEKDFKIRKNRKSRFSLMEENRYLVGVFRANEKGFGFVKIENQDEEIYISNNNTKFALNGDKVVVELLYNDRNNDIHNVNNNKHVNNNIHNVNNNKHANNNIHDVNSNKHVNNNMHNVNSSNHIEGKIVKIILHEKKKVVGTFTSNRNFGFVVPDDKNFGSDIYIQKKNIGKAKNNDKVVVEITKYPQQGKKAEGNIVEIIGNINQAGVDILSLVKEYCLPYEFPNNVIKEAKNIENKIPLEEINKRRDFRNEKIVTIDGEDAKDLDDAVYVKKLENGNYELGVHIADVSFYVQEGTKLDKEAILRGTSIYMLDRVIPMLPKELSNGICSLNEKEDRLTLSVIMEINKAGEVVSSDITKGIINVKKRMNYTDVASYLGYNCKKINEEYNEFDKELHAMDELAKILKKKRQKQGSLNLDLPESKIVLDENGVAIDVKKYEMTFANEIIEQFMLTCNETIAERFFWLEAPFIYRVHELPDEEKINELNKFLFNFGYKIKGSKDNIHPKAFAQILEDIKGKEEERVVSTLILRTLKVARYESQNKGHFGIASKYYCHFTSPIRRYPDLFIHRIISMYLDKNYNINSNQKEKYSIQATNYAESSSEREKIAQKVERDSVNIKMAEYMQEKIGEEYDGIISSVTSFGIFVELENTVEGLIRFENLGDEYFIYDENRKILTGEKTNKTFKIGDKVRVRVIKANKALRQIDFEIVEKNSVIL